VSRAIAIVLARGGSKRLPRKNIVDLAGKPMLAWSVEAALDSGCFDRVLVSTDDAEIARVGRHFGAEVPFLRTRAADDHAPASDATRVALAQAEHHWGDRYDYVAQLMANCPLRNAQDTKDGFRAFLRSGAPAQISAFRFGWMNPWWAARISDERQPTYLFPDAHDVRSQDLPPLYCPTGAFWIAHHDQFLEAGSFYMPAHVLYPMDWMSALDIDDEDDLRMARACFALRGEPSCKSRIKHE